MGDMGQNATTNDCFLLSLKNFEWKELSFKDSPTERCLFTWVKIDDNTAVLFGGASYPADFLYKDVWVFHFQGLFELENSKSPYDYWIKINSHVTI